VETGQAPQHEGVPRAPDLSTSDRRAYRFSTLYESQYRTVYAFVLRRLVGPRDDASDITAEIFAIVWRKLDRVPAPPEDRLWIFGVARRVLGRHQRSMWRGSRLLRRLEAEASLGLRTEDSLGRTVTDRERVQAAIARLKPSDREVLSLVLWEQLSHSEAAQVLGCSANAVGLRLHKARSRLREELALDRERSAERSQDPDGLQRRKGLER
jgi:RNA polymerase sigma-70 factor (ECF subfamily)